MKLGSFHKSCSEYFDRCSEDFFLGESRSAAPGGDVPHSSSATLPDLRGYFAVWDAQINISCVNHVLCWGRSDTLNGRKFALEAPVVSQTCRLNKQNNAVLTSWFSLLTGSVLKERTKDIVTLWRKRWIWSSKATKSSSAWCRFYWFWKQKLRQQFRRQFYAKIQEITAWKNRPRFSCINALQPTFIINLVILAKKKKKMLFRGLWLPVWFGFFQQQFPHGNQRVAQTDWNSLFLTWWGCKQSP